MIYSLLNGVSTDSSDVKISHFCYPEAWGLTQIYKCFYKLGLSGFNAPKTMIFSSGLFRLLKVKQATLFLQQVIAEDIARLVNLLQVTLLVNDWSQHQHQIYETWLQLSQTRHQHTVQHHNVVTVKAPITCHDDHLLHKMGHRCCLSDSLHNMVWIILWR